MGFQEQMLKMMIDSKSPEEISRITLDLMPQIMQKMGTEEMTRIVISVLPRLLEKMDGCQVEDMMINLLPRIMDTSFSTMDKSQRKFMVKHIRDMLHKMEEKYPV